jgi:predicted restriction endonuclease
MINDERLLIASHIKPWAVSSDKEKTDPHNGYMLSPLYDRLFDRGLITFTDDRKMLVSNWISPKNVQRMGLEDGRFYQSLPTGEERLRYLEYHRECVFKG